MQAMSNLDGMDETMLTDSQLPDDMDEDMLNDSQLPGPTCGEVVQDTRPTASETPSAMTADPKELGNKKGRKHTEMIADPPQLNPSVLEAAKSQVPANGVDGNLEGQRALKKKLDDEAKAEIERKKQQAIDKKEQASNLAVEKAKLKLERAMAKAEAVKARKQPVKRKLDAEFAECSDVQPPEPPVGPKEKKGKARVAAQVTAETKSPMPKVQLTPRAKVFAGRSASSPKEQAGNKAQKRKDNREATASASLALLRSSQLVDLDLPDESFAKKILACTYDTGLKVCMCVCGLLFGVIRWGDTGLI